MSDTVLTIKLPKELRDRIQEHATKDQRTASAWARKLLDNATKKTKKVK